MNICHSYSLRGIVYLAVFSVFSGEVKAELKLTYGVPEGFGDVQMEETARFVGSLNGVTLPDYISYSQSLEELTFDEDKYRVNGVSESDITTLNTVFEKLKYKTCSNGCDVNVAGQHVTIDKVKRSISIRNENDDYIVPDTDFGLVSNHRFDLRTSSDGYRSMNLAGDSWLGLPSQSFAYVNWFSNTTENRGANYRSQGVSSYFLQKNFASTYVRAGKQNAIDFSSGTISTLLSPSFDNFLTIGSQSHMEVSANTGMVLLYANSEGSYEVYRNGRMILKRPAVLGRNEIGFSDLPGGYYPVEIRLVDRNGNIVSREDREVNNVNFAGGAGANSWHLTMGQEMTEGGGLLEGGFSRDMSWFYLNASAVSGREGRWASEMNVTRPTTLSKMQITPTLGLMSGEKNTGGYASLNLSDPLFGSLMVSQYQRNDVSHYYSSAGSTSFNYSLNVRGVMLSYNYQRGRTSELQRAEVRWNYRPNGLWSTIAVGVGKGGYTQNLGDYSVYLNMTWTIDRSQASFSAAHTGGQTQLSGDYSKNYVDTYGTTNAGLTASQVNEQKSVNLHASRSGSRGDVSINLGHSDTANNIDLSYQGMVAANTQGLSLGKYSGSGSAMLLRTPELADTDYGFVVEGSQVSGGSTYAVPLNRYQDITFARVLTESQDMDMNIEVPANIIRAHPGQVYNALASVDVNMLYSGFLRDSKDKPVSGKVEETGDNVYPNGLFSIVSKSPLSQITISRNRQSYICDLRNPINSFYACKVNK